MNPDEFLTGDPETDRQRQEAYNKFRDAGMPEQEALQRIQRIQPHQEAMKAPTAGEFAGGLARSGVQGATLGFGDEAEGLLRGAGALLPGGRSPGEAYREGRDHARGSLDDFREHSPGLALGAEVAGSVVGGLGAAGGLRAGAKLAGRAGTAGRVGRGAQRAVDAGKAAYSTTPRVIGTNAAAGAAYGAGASEGGLGERARGGLGGGVAGGAAGALFPVARTAGRVLRKPGRAALAGAGLGGGAAAVGQARGDGLDAGDIDNVGGAAAIAAGLAAAPAAAWRTIAPRMSKGAATSMADDAVIEAMRNDELTREGAGEIIRGAGRLRGPEVSLADMGDNLLGLAQGASGVRGSQTANRMQESLGNRLRGRLDRTTADLEDAFGVPSGMSDELAPANPNQARQGVLARKRDAEAGPLYQQARGTIAPRPLREAVMRDTPTMEKVRRQAAKLAGDAGMDPDAVRRRLEDGTIMSTDDAHFVRQALDDILSRSAPDPGSLGANQRRAVTGLRSDLTDELRAASDPFAAADDAWAHRSREIDAIDLARGSGTGNKRFSTKLPEEIRRDVAGLAENERVMYTIGAIDDIRRNLDKSGNMEARVMGRNEGFNTEGLKALLGSAPVEDLGRKLELETRMQRTADEIMRSRNSRTTPFREAIDHVEGHADLRKIATDTFRDLFPSLRTAPNVADELGAAMELRGDDLLRYLDELQKRLERQAAAGDRGRARAGLAGLGTSAAVGRGQAREDEGG